MVNIAFLTSEIIAGAFTVRYSLQEQNDGTYLMRSAYWRNGRNVAYYKGRVEVDACNVARNELIAYLESIGWKQEADFFSNPPTYTGGVAIRWTPPENDPEGDDPNEGESFDAFMMRTVYAPAWAQGEYPDLGDV